MKTIIMLFIMAAAASCYGKDLKPKKTVTPIQMVAAAYELFTFTPETPVVVIAEKVIVNGRATVRLIQPVKK